MKKLLFLALLTPIVFLGQASIDENNFHKDKYDCAVYGTHSFHINQYKNNEKGPGDVTIDKYLNFSRIDNENNQIYKIVNFTKKTLIGNDNTVNICRFKGLGEFTNTKGEEYDSPLHDGWSLFYIDGELARKRFYINNHLLFEEKAEFYSEEVFSDTCRLGMGCGYDNNFVSFNNLPKKINEFDIVTMVNVFLFDIFNNLKFYGLFGDYNEISEIWESIPYGITETGRGFTRFEGKFETLEGNTIAVSEGFENDFLIKITIDPAKWASASSANRWYILYHELGHDILNLKHGEGGRMMFNYPTKDYTWEDFQIDRDHMFRYYFKQQLFSNSRSNEYKIIEQSEYDCF